jgi:hypothetical protein
MRSCGLGRRRRARQAIVLARQADMRDRQENLRTRQVREGGGLCVCECVSAGGGGE